MALRGGIKSGAAMGEIIKNGKPELLELQGESGKHYVLKAYAGDASFDDDFGAVYILTKRAESEEASFHRLLYIGQTSHLGERMKDHVKTLEAKKHGMNCVCVLAVSDHEERLHVETDLRHLHNTPLNEHDEQAQG
jgi:predicted GIY-YIG superfamily endonuclease